MALPVVENVVTGSLGAGGGDSVASASHTPVEGETLIAYVHLRATGITPTLSGNGQTWVQRQDVTNTQTQFRTFMFSVDSCGASPTAGAVTATITGNTTPALIIVARVSGTHATAPRDVTVSDAGPDPDDDDVTIDITTLTADSRILFFAGYRNKAFTTPAGQTEEAQVSADDGGNSVRGTLVSDDAATTGTYTMGGLASLDADHDHCELAVALIPPAGGGGGGAPTHAMDYAMRRAA